MAFYWVKVVHIALCWTVFSLVNEKQKCNEWILHHAAFPLACGHESFRLVNQIAKRNLKMTHGYPYVLSH
jgi:hypothetical protein